MKNILLLNDFSTEAEHALAYGTLLATALQTNLLVWNICERVKPEAKRELVYVGTMGQQNNTLMSLPEKEAVEITHVHPLVKYLTKKDTDQCTVQEIVTQHSIQMVIKGVNDPLNPLDKLANQVLTTSCCPLLLVPAHASLKLFEQATYISDLRYCRNNINSYLKDITHELNTGFTVAHISTSNIPELDGNYAQSLYKEIIGTNYHNTDLSFSHVKERDVRKATDVLIHMMNTDLLVMVYRKYHYNSLTAKTGEQTGMEDINVPMLLFPS